MTSSGALNEIRRPLYQRRDVVTSMILLQCIGLFLNIEVRFLFYDEKRASLVLLLKLDLYPDPNILK